MADDHDDGPSGDLEDLASMLLDGHDDPFVLVISNVAGGYDVPTGFLDTGTDAIKIFCATKRYFMPYTLLAKEVFATELGVGYESTLGKTADGRHPVDALFKDHHIPNDAIVIVFADEIEWITDLQITKKVIERVGENGHLTVVLCTCGIELKQLKLDGEIPVPPLETAVTTSDCTGKTTMEDIIQAFIEVAHGPR